MEAGPSARRSSRGSGECRGAYARVRRIEGLTKRLGGCSVLIYSGARQSGLLRIFVPAGII